MAALSQNRLTVQSGGSGSSPVPSIIELPVADNVHIYAGALVQINASTGYATPAGSATQADTHTFFTVGRAEAEADNTVAGHSAGAITVRIKPGCFLWDVGTSGDALTQANVGVTVYAIDDHTVGLTSNTSTRASAGKLIGIDASGAAIVFTMPGIV